MKTDFKILGFLFLLFGLQYCKVIRTDFNGSDENEGKTFMLYDTVLAEVIDFIPAACNCTGVVSCASSCLCYSHTLDTFRVITLCNENTSILKGMKIIIIPNHPPIPPYSISVCAIETKEGIKVIDYSEYKTTYGRLLKY